MIQNSMKISIPAGFAGADTFDPASRIIPVLLVFGNPLDLDRLCRYLERNGDISAEISQSCESALHLMQYIRFPVVIAEYASDGPDPLQLVKMMRKQSLCTPLIYYDRTHDAARRNDAGRYGPVYFVTRHAGTPFPQADTLEAVIRRAVAES